MVKKRVLYPASVVREAWEAGECYDYPFYLESLLKNKKVVVIGGKIEVVK